MIDAIIKWSLQHRLIVILAACGLVLWGALRMQTMPVDVFPDLTAPTVTVVSEAHGMAPEEVEQLITFPVESALNGASGVRRVRSTTTVGMSIIWVEFEWGQDIYTARQIVSEKLQLVQTALPPEVEKPIMAPISSIMGSILFVGVHSDKHTPEQLRTLADWDIRRRLLAVPGVSQVITMGGDVKQFQVRVRPVDLVRHDVSLEEVFAAVEQSNENTSAGFYQQAGKEYLLYGMGRVQDTKDLEQTVIRARHEGGSPLLVSDVADVIIGSGLKRGDASISGNPGVVLVVQKQPGINTLALSNKIETVLAEIDRSLPEGIVLEKRLFRQADFIESSLDNVMEALRDGSILVILIIGIFLFSGRATLITAMAIPVSLIASVLVLDFMGLSLNTMSLGGMAIAVGALVDDAIIDVENVVRRLREHQHTQDAASTPTREVIFLASKEIRSSIVFATLIIVLVFLPLFFLHGLEGKLLAPLGIAYVVSLVASLATALTLTPALCSLLLPSSGAVKRGLEPRFVHAMRGVYERMLSKILGYWKVSVIACIAMFSAACVSLFTGGMNFLPEFNEGALTISAVTYPGTSLQESNRIGKEVEEILLAQPEISTTTRRTGRAEQDEHAQGVNSSEVEVKLDMKERSQQELLAVLREEFSKLNGVNIVIGQPISHRIDHMLSGTRANIAVKIFGEDHDTLKQLASEVQQEMSTIPGVVDLAIEEQSHLPMASMRLKRDVLARYQLSVQDVSHTIETAFYGRKVSKILEGSSAFDLVVRYEGLDKLELKQVKETMIRAPGGVWVPLEELADITEDVGINQISRENGQRKMVVMCNVSTEYSMGDVVSSIATKLNKNVERPAGYYIEYGGQFEAAESASKMLLFLGIMSIVGIAVLLFMALHSGRNTVLVMLNLPLALIGGVVGVYIAGGTLSVASIIGFITLFGIATRNGIMLVTHMVNVHMEEGLAEDDAILKGASERLVPILMTALASGLGLLPLALAMGEPGSEIQAPMAIVILCGLGTSTTLNMLIVPVMMKRFGELDVDELNRD